MNPALRCRAVFSCYGTLLAVVLASGLAIAATDARPLPSSNSVSRSQFLKAARRLGHTAVDELEGSRPQAAASAQSGDPTPGASQPAKLADLGWLAGRWVGKWGPRTAEQVWTSPQAELMLGAFRVFEDDHTLLIELFTLEQTRNGVELHFRHFTPDLVPWEPSAATELSLQSYDSKKWVFLNSANGQPRRSIFIRVDSDTYTLRSEISSGKGPMRVVDITFQRQGSPSRRTRNHVPKERK